MRGSVNTVGVMPTQSGPDPHARRDRLLGADEFPVVERCTYLSICDSTVLSRRVRAAVDDFLDHVMYWRETRAVRELRVDGARSKLAELIHASPADVAIIKNVSEGINAIATSIPWRAGDNVVLCAELEHPNNVLPWIHLRRLGVEMRVVEPIDGANRRRCHHCRNQRADAGRHMLVGHFLSRYSRTDLGTIGRACRSPRRSVSG